MKYIIDIPEEITNGGFQVRVEKPGDRYGKFVGYALKPVPFDEQDDCLWDKGYASGVRDGRKFGQDEVWDFVREIVLYDNDFGMEELELEECFGFNLYSKMFKNLSYSEAKAKYDAWKAEKEKIHIGDEVEYTGCDKTIRFVVTGIVDNKAYGFKYPSDYDDVGDYCDVTMLTKTGRHIDGVEELLKQMKKGV